MRSRWGFHQRLAAAGILACMGPPGLAAPLSPGSIIVGPAGTTAAAEPWLAGTIVEDAVTPFSYDGWFTDSSFPAPVTTIGAVTGTVQSRVIRAVDDTYDFYWRISVDERSFLPLLDFTVAGFAPGAYSANWRADGSGSVVPAFIEQSLAGGIHVAFGEFIHPSAQVHPGEQSRFFFLDTAARGYSNGASFALASGRDTGGSMLIQWGGSSGLHATFGPTPVPEPAAAWLMLGGLGVLAAAARFSRRR